MRQMEQELTNLAEPNKHFVLLKHQDFSCLCTRAHFDVLINFHGALSLAETWGDFWGMLSLDTRDFIRPFTETDQRTPKTNDKVVDLEDEVYILGDKYFPIVQYIEETTTAYGAIFPSELRLDSIKTEYGMHFDIYHPDKTEEIITMMRSKGVTIEVVTSPFSIPL